MNGGLAGEGLPPGHCHIDVVRVDFHSASASADPLGRKHRRARAGEGVEHDVITAGAVLDRIRDHGDGLDGRMRSQIIHRTMEAISKVVPSLRPIDPNGLLDAHVKGGVIVAWGKTDIYDPESELHRRYEIGIRSAGRFHSVDPGKLTMAPFFADQLAKQLYGPA